MGKLARSRKSTQNSEGAELDTQAFARIPDDIRVLLVRTPHYRCGDEIVGGQHPGCRELFHACVRLRPEFCVFGHKPEPGMLQDVFLRTTYVKSPSCSFSYPNRKPAVFDVLI